MNRQRVLSARITAEARRGQGTPEAVEIVENFHGLLHGFTFVALAADVSSRETALE